MTCRLAASAIAVLICAILESPTAIATPFTNLDFEQSLIPVDQPGPASYPVADAMPGWRVLHNGQPSSVVSYNQILLGGTWITLLGTAQPHPSVIQGFYTPCISVLLPEDSIALSQAGDVPADALSVRFLADLGSPIAVPWPHAIHLRMNGQPLSLVEMNSTGTRFLLGADVAAWAGTTAELQISVSPDPEWHLAGASIDAISFSSEAIPEPGSGFFVFMLGIGAGVTRGPAGRR